MFFTPSTNDRNSLHFEDIVCLQLKNIVIVLRCLLIVVLCCLWYCSLFDILFIRVVLAFDRSLKQQVSAFEIVQNKIKCSGSGSGSHARGLRCAN